MTLNEYIKMSYERPNRKVLEGLGASESLIEYLMETPGNMNWQVAETIKNSGGDVLASHTFHFELTEIEMGTFLICEEIDTWLNYLDTSIDGKILKGTISNVVQDGSPVGVELSDQYYMQSAYKDISELGPEAGTIMYQQPSNDNINDGIMIGYIPTYHILYAQEIECDSFDITLELQEGYKITIDMPAGSEIEAMIDYHYVKVKKGGSWVVADIVHDSILTDGTNTYRAGDIITPISDMTLTILEITATFYNENNELMEGVRRYITQDQAYPYTNPYRSTKFDLPNGDKNGILRGTWSWHDSEGDHTANVLTKVTITEPTDFIFHPTA